MPTYTVCRDFAGSVERVFALMTDFEHAAENISAIKNVEVLTDGPIGVGTRFRETREMMGREATETMTITQYDPLRGFTLEAMSCGARFVMNHRFSADDGAGGCHVELEMVITPVTLMAKLFSPLSRLMAGPMIKCIERDFDDIARIIEAPAAA